HLDRWLRVIDLNNRSTAQVTVLGKMRRTVGNGKDAIELIVNATGSAVIQIDHPATGVSDRCRPDLIRQGRTVGVAVLDLRCGGCINHAAVSYEFGVDLTKVIILHCDLVKQRITKKRPTS